jgi:stress response protein SCP2
MAALTQGSRAPLPGGPVQVRVDTGGRPAVDVSAVLTTAAGRVRSDADLVFYNQPQSVDGAVRYDPATGGLHVDPGAVAPDVTAIVVIGSADPDRPGGTVADSAPLTVTVAGSGEPCTYAVEPAGAETALILVELYRHGEAWKVKAVGQGWASGLAGIATSYGLDVADVADVADDAGDASDVAAAPPPPPPPGPAPEVPATPATPASPADAAAPPMPGPSLTKPMPALAGGLAERVGPRVEQADRVVLTKGLAGITLRVACVLDASLSMEDLYRRGVVARAVERVAIVADRLDDDRTLQTWVFADRAKALPDLALPDLDAWVSHHVPEHPKSFKVGIGNDEPVVMGAVCEAFGIRWDDGAGGGGPGSPRPGGPPVLVILFSDGGVYEDEGIEAIVRSTSDQPLCWVFVGLGTDDFGALQSIDALGGRVVDNAGFFQVDDLDRVDDEELYHRLLTPVAEWHRAATAHGII